MENLKDGNLKTALKDFQKQYPQADSGDLQTFILGYRAACALPPVVVSPERADLPSDVKITTTGLMNGNWQIKITGIPDRNLYDAEVGVLGLFGQKKGGN